MATVEKVDEIQSPNKNTESVGIDSIPSTPNESEDRNGGTIDDDQHIRLGWKTWLVVFITCFGYVSLSLALTEARRSSWNSTKYDNFYKKG